MDFQTVYLPIGVPSYDLDEARMKYNDSIGMLKLVDKNIVVPDGPIVSVNELRGFLKDKKPTFAIVQNLTFATGVFITEILRNVDCPVLLWTIPEPVIDGQRLRLNSLTGAYSAANVMGNLGKNFCYVIGSTFADETVDEIKAALLAAKLKHSLTKLNLLQVG
ncbi:MAG: fucose isomerase, partial [Clostridia bacterium]|nr:fucose isomerase [Clostridia bacterium]